ncbi:MAG: hypothetical protein LBK72_03500, partial [Bifidobacteriaceae bacterium]|nr:hypothetical protein [Bifidobacteriaceae bacterium]
MTSSSHPIRRGKGGIAAFAAIAVALPVTVAGLGTSAALSAPPGTENVALYRSVIVDNWTRTAPSVTPWWTAEPQADAVITETDQTGQLLTDGIFDPDGDPDFPLFSTGFTTTGADAGNAYPYRPREAFDGRKDTYWQASVPDPSAGVPYLQVDLPAPVTIASYALTNTGNIRELSSEAEVDYRAPQDWTLEGWNGSAWVTLDQQTAQSFDSRVLAPDGSVADTPGAVYTARRQTLAYDA